MQCGRNDIDESISIMRLKRFATDYEFSRKVSGMAAETTHQQKIAIVGSGPAGLTAANDLAMAGFPVTVFDGAERAGGIMAWGIPDFRLPKNILRSEIRDIQNLGIDIQTEKRIDEPTELLQQGYSAIVLAMGCQLPVKPNIEGAENAIECLEFLRDVSEGKITELPGNTIVIGGGNAALDSARTAVRLGSKVTIIYRRTRDEMPAGAEEIQQAKEEGIEFIMQAMPHSITAGSMVFQQVRMGEPDESGRRRPVPIPDEFFTVDADNIIMALGSRPEVLSGGLKTTRWDTLVTDELAMTSQPGIFAAGDIVSGPASIVEAIGSGHRAANGIVKFLLGQEGMFGSVESREMLIIEAEEPEPQDRVGMECIPGEKRLTTFDEVEVGMSEQDAVAEADRCRRCGSCSVCSVCLSVCEYRNAVITVRETGESALAKIPFDIANAPDSDWKITGNDEKVPVTMESLLASVNEELCIACGRCEDSCPYKAIRTVFDRQGNVHAQVNASACRGCGACTAICPTGAMEVGYFDNSRLFPRVQEALEESPDGIIRFSCIWHDFDAGISSKPGEIKLQCTRRASPALILEALASGARGVAVFGCQDDECHYLPGPWMGQDVVESCKNILQNIGMDPDRVQYLEDDTAIPGSAKLAQLRSNANNIPDIRPPMGRALNAIQILMAQPDTEPPGTASGKSLLGQGCLAMSEPLFLAHGFDRPDIMDAVKKLLEYAGVDYELAPEIHISGNSLKEWGMDELYQQYSDSIFRRVGGRNLIIPTPKTWLAFRENYPDMNIISLPQLLTGKLRFNNADMTVAYHRSCADGGNFDEHCLELLKEIPGLKIVELDGKCGDTGWRFVGSGSRETGQALLESAEKTGADILISSSSRCTAHLGALKSGWCQSGIEVLDMFSFLVRYISADKKSGGSE
jgi:NADPH-dependent glutamate synthase beta subunit-like oxidoreductase/Fe-S oxidoreductase/coenzyme F420-reducing hydrogenase delta subunit